ncbi:MAG: SpoIIIAH-like family protein [Oscillospiraceae bacterium]|nr:SpoIIIAH-like family protein [Oscillospiraceae bacterium]
MNMILNKRHIILAALVLVLGIAVYLNWVYGGEDLTLTEQMQTAKNYGDAKLVDANTPQLSEDVEAVAASGSFFSEARLNRQKSRDSAIDALTGMFQDASLSDTEKAQLALQAAAVADAIETEGKIENMIKAKGFSDCMVYIDGERVDAIVKTNGLLEEEVAQIKDILVAETGATEENISITEAQ